MGRNGFISSNRHFSQNDRDSVRQAETTTSCLAKLGRRQVRMALRPQLYRGSSKMWSKTYVHAYAFLLIFIFNFFPADGFVCPEPCTCSSPSQNPSTEWTSTITIPSINCSNRSLDDFIGLIYSTYDIENNASSSEIVQEHRIHFLDMSNNRFKILQLVETATWGNTTSWLGIDAIDLSHNFISGFIVDDVCMLASVSTLDLSFNRVESLNDLTGPQCPGFHYLQELNVSHNSINELENSSFSSLLLLTTLDLSFNKMQTIPSASFEGLTSLQYLFLSANNLNRITTVFPSLLNLAHLDLSNNFLEYLPNGLFSKLISLQSLNLDNNKIIYLEANAFNGLSNLIELSMNGNLLTSLNEPVFQNTSLKRLSLASMPNLVNVSHDVFCGLGHLQYLNMSKNQQLTFLQPNILSALNSLQTLDLSRSGFHQLSSTTFSNPELRRVLLRGLRFSCVCTNAWLVAESLKNDSAFVDLNSSHCVDTKNQSLDIATADFNCGPVFINNTLGKVAVHLGSELLLPCEQVSDEMAVLTWTTPSGQKLYHHDFHPDALLHLLSREEVQSYAPFHKNHYWHHSSSYHSEISNSDRIIILTDGSLYVDYMLRQDAGEYKCEVKNSHYNHSITVTLHLDYDISGRIKMFAFLVGFLCALGFFTLNVVYVVISWTARRLVNKRRRATIIQMLENLNAYKSTQITRIHENYTHQLNRVRNQYHIQRDRLHSHYSGQVNKVKRGCSNQVEKVRENYHSKLVNLREYSSRQVLQIRESANNQIGRIRDYGSLQLERLRETYKLQQRHVLKLLDTMNLDNCRSVVETECMRTESMMFDLDLLEPDDRIDSPTSPESEYNTAASSPNSDRFSVEIGDQDSCDDELQQRIFTQAESSVEDNESQNESIVIEMNTSLSMAGGIHVDAKEVWKYSDDDDDDDMIEDHILYTKIHGPDHYPLSRHKQTKSPKTFYSDNAQNNQDQQSELPPIPLYTVTLKHHWDIEQPPVEDERGDLSNSEETWSEKYVTPEASPVKICQRGDSTDQSKFALEDVTMKNYDSKGQDEDENEL